jgi:hypothetical protein
MRELNIFVGYQFKSAHFKRTEFDSTVVNSIERANADINIERISPIKLRLVTFDLDSGDQLSKQILDRIERTDICVFELSDMNNNVFFELGFGIGRNKPCILLLHEDSTLPVPSDISGVFLLSYTIDTLGAKLGSEIRRRAEAVLDVEEQMSREYANEEHAKAIRSFWGLRGETSVHLVCPEIPEEDRIIYANAKQRDYLRLGKFADIDSLYHLKAFLAKYFPEIQCSECTSEELATSAYTETLILIGGPAWNKVTADMGSRIRLPWIYRDGGRGNDDPLEDSRTGVRHLPMLGADGSLLQDIGLFVRVPNPANRRRHLFMINGIRTYGVLGAARCFINNGESAENCLMVTKKLGSLPRFAAVFRVPVINNFVAVPNLSADDTLIDLLEYTLQKNSFSSIL